MTPLPLTYSTACGNTGDTSCTPHSLLPSFCTQFAQLTRRQPNSAGLALVIEGGGADETRRWPKILLRPLLARSVGVSTIQDLRRIGQFGFAPIKSVSAPLSLPDLCFYFQNPTAAVGRHHILPLTFLHQSGRRRRQQPGPPQMKAASAPGEERTRSSPTTTWVCTIQIISASTPIYQGQLKFEGATLQCTRGN